MIELYERLHGKKGDVAEDYNCQVFEDGTKPTPTRLTREEFFAKFPPPTIEPHIPTPEELQATAQAQASAILAARAQRQLAQAESFTAAEFTVFAKAGLFPVWAAGESYVKGNRIVHDGVVYEVQQAVAAQAHQPPGGAGMLAVYRPLSVDAGTGAEPDGSKANPYTFINGMDVFNGKYYKFKDKLYLAKSDMKPCVWNPGMAGLWQWSLVE